MTIVGLQSEAGGEENDFLPGLYKMAQQWMGEVAVEKFPELSEMGTNLDEWFQHRKVKSHLKARSDLEPA